jgi:hypothetical protein
VLGHLPAEEMKALPDILTNAAAGIEAWASLDLDRAMSRVNVKQGGKGAGEEPDGLKGSAPSGSK